MTKPTFTPADIQILRTRFALEEAEDLHDFTYAELAELLLEGLTIPTTLRGLLEDYGLAAVFPNEFGLWTYGQIDDEYPDPHIYLTARQAAIAYLQDCLKWERENNPEAQL